MKLNGSWENGWRATEESQDFHIIIASITLPHSYGAGMNLQLNLQDLKIIVAGTGILIEAVLTIQN